MRGLLRVLGRVLALLVFVVVAMWALGPYEDSELAAGFDPSRLGNGVQTYFDAAEARFHDITPGVEKRVIWAGEPETKTPFAVVYLHGFSATSEEIRPVPDRIAQALGANLVFTRLTGHGRPGDAMGAVTVPLWMADTAEALAAARAVGEKVIVVSTSTGGTLSAAAAVDPSLSQSVAAMIMVSPNFGINHPLADLATYPAARYWIPLIEGERRSWTPKDDTHATYWTTDYPTTAGVVLAALVKAVDGLDFARADIPALFWFSAGDETVRPDKTREIAGRWGGAATVNEVTVGPGDDDHVIAGDIRSPGQTDAAVAGMLAWLAEQGIE